jgi:hypothetical protein
LQLDGFWTSEEKARRNAFFEKSSLSLGSPTFTIFHAEAAKHLIFVNRRFDSFRTVVMSQEQLQAESSVNFCNHF